MRPEKDRSISRQAAVARGRMMVRAHMGWLPGFPVGVAPGEVEWVTVPRHSGQAPERIQLNGDHIREATYTFNKLLRHFPRALPYVVEDQKNWVERVPRLLDWLKGAIHHDVLLSESLLLIKGAFPHKSVLEAEYLVQHQPELARLVHALGWVSYLTPQDFSNAVFWIDQNKHRIKTILDVYPGSEEISLGAMLWELTRRDDQRRMEPLLQWLGDMHVHTVAMHGGEGVVKYWQTILQKRKPDLSEPLVIEPRTGRALVEFATWMMQQGQGTRRRALSLYALLLPEHLPQTWADWWDRVEPLQKRARRLAALPVNERTEVETRDVFARLKIAEQTIPPLIHIDRFLALIQTASQQSLQKLHRQICQTLPELPCESDAGLVRVAFLDHWVYLGSWHQSRLSGWLRYFRSFLKYEIDPTRLLSPWQDVVKNWNRTRPNSTWSITGLVLDEVSPQRLQSVVLDALATCCKKLEDDLLQQDAERLIDLVLLTKERDEVVDWFFALLQADFRETYLPRVVLKYSHALVSTPEQRVIVADRLLKAHRENDSVCDLLMLVDTELEGYGWHGLAGRCILEGNLKSILKAGEWLRVLKALKGRAEPPLLIEEPVVPTWAYRYGSAFESVLATLVAYVPEAELVAKRILEKHFPDQDDLRREIAALEDRITEQPDSDPLRRRLENLRKRLKQPVPVKPARQARLIQKVERSIDRMVLETWMDRLNIGVRKQVPILMKTDSVPAWFYEPRVLQVLAPMLGLSGVFRNLGLRLLRLRCGPPPWNLPDDPANQAFVDRMAREGIHMQPWLEPPETQTLTGKNGRTVHVSFELDPLEIFHMGGHFKTCLSPGQFNFFSVFANAADINKHVVYARDEQGQVLGRCLLAVSDQGGLLVFEPYCHDPALGFSNMMSEVAADLAVRMHTVVVREGNVSSLVAPDWYDDGPRDLGHRFEFLDEGSPFRLNLPEMDLKTLIPSLKLLFDPLPLNSLTLTLVLKLKEFEDRPELVRPLFPLLKSCKGVSGPVWIDSACYAFQADADWFARRVLREHIAPYVLGMYRQYGWVDSITLDRLVDIDASFGLQLLRRTRERGVRSDEAERDPGRRALIAKALEALGRSKQAEGLVAG